MRHFLRCLCALVVLLAGPQATYAAANVKARLVSEVTSIAPGESIWVALVFDIRAGWHTYWKNPGDSGQATRLEWSLPAGVEAGEIVWPTPHRFELPPLVNYGYADHAVHLVQIKASPALSGTAQLPARLHAKASWLVCSDVCVPEEAELELLLPVVAAGSGNGSGSGGVPVDPAQAALFAAARAALPQPAPAPATFRSAAGAVTVTLGSAWGTTLSQIETLQFFPSEPGAIDYGAAQKITRSAGSLQLELKAGYRPPGTSPLRGVLVASERNGSARVDVPLELAAQPGAAASAGGDAPTSLPALLGLALLGGMILNLMPCVFPVLSIKAIGLVEQSKKNPAAVRAKGLLFAAGVIGSMLTLAGALLALRAGGQQLGWGFQLQSPLFVCLMVYLLLAVGLNLSGVFEISGGLAGVGDGLTRGDSYRAAFFTGVLTTLVATPCTAPFMAAAVGAALTQSPLVALTIFAALGCGLSLPYVVLSVAPWSRRALPRPGAWMDTLKQAFAFPMYASAAWLLWVLSQQTSSTGLAAALCGTVLVALAAWSYQKSRASGGAARARIAGAVTAAAALVLAVALSAKFTSAPAPAEAAGSATAAGADGWQPYDAARLSELTAAGRPLLVNFTASWCLTCLVNERSAFADPAVQNIFRARDVTLMKGDWTNRDPSITAALASFGRAGVPLYVVYNGAGAEPRILPQLLTAGIVRDAFAGSTLADVK